MEANLTRTPIREATIASIMTFAAWWAGLLYLDGVVARRLPYSQYETISLLYPDIFYPVLPGWILAHAQPFAVGLYLVTLGWMIVLIVAVGAVSARLASRQGWSPWGTPVAVIAVLFVLLTVGEAIALNI